MAMMMCPVLAAAGPLITLNVADEEVAPVLQSIARISGKNIAIDHSVRGQVTAQLREVPFETALDIITKLTGLSYQTVGDVIVVSPTHQLGKRFGELHIFRLNYAQAEDILPNLQMMYGEMSAAKLSATTRLAVTDAAKTDVANRDSNARTETAAERVTTVGTKAADRWQVDRATNSIVFWGTTGEAEQIRKLLGELDIAYQQVALEAQVVALSKSASKSLGVEWQWSATPTWPETTDDGGTTTVTREHHWGTIRFGKSPGGMPYEFYYQSKINALVTDGDAEILARPKITTINGREAVINIGDEVPIPVTTTQNDVTTSSIEYKKVGIILKYTPQINVDGQITATVHTEVSSPVLVSELKAYRFTTRSADTQVRLKDGETMVIGGLIGKEDTRSYSKVPGLSNLPIVGKLFQSTSRSKTDTEVVIFLTARIVK